LPRLRLIVVAINFSVIFNRLNQGSTFVEVVPAQLFDESAPFIRLMATFAPNSAEALTLFWTMGLTWG
jgi:hypothetical protein